MEELKFLYSFHNQVADNVQSQVSAWMKKQFGNGVQVESPASLNLTVADISEHAQTLITVISFLLVLNQEYKKGHSLSNINKSKMLAELEEALLKRGIFEFKVLAWNDYEAIFKKPPGICKILIEANANKKYLVEATRKRNRIILSQPTEISTESTNNTNELAK